MFQKHITEQLVRIFHFTMDEALLKRLEDNDELKQMLRQSLGIEHHTLLMQATLDKDTAKATELLCEHVHFATRFFDAVYTRDS